MRRKPDAPALAGVFGRVACLRRRSRHARVGLCCGRSTPPAHRVSARFGNASFAEPLFVRCCNGRPVAERFLKMRQVLGGLVRRRHAEYARAEISPITVGAYRYVKNTRRHDAVAGEDTDARARATRPLLFQLFHFGPTRVRVAVDPIEYLLNASMSRVCEVANRRTVTPPECDRSFRVFVGPCDVVAGEVVSTSTSCCRQGVPRGRRGARRRRGLPHRIAE